VIERILDYVFDPLWNAQHRVTIWLTIAVVLFLSGVGLPLPEDVPLTASGFTTYKQAGDTFIWWRYLITFATVTVPILLGDLCAYSLGKKFGFGLRNRWKLLRRSLSDRRLARVQRWFDQYGSFTVFLGRQVAGVRFVTFYTAGTMRMNIFKFIAWDFVGCFVSVPVWLTLGTLAARYGRVWLGAATSRVGTGFLLVVLVLAVGLVLFAKWRARRAAEPRATPPA
jgi:membrane protein DedA with SNARE-associated domain